MIFIKTLPWRKICRPAVLTGLLDPRALSPSPGLCFSSSRCTFFLRVLVTTSSHGPTSPTPGSLCHYNPFRGSECLFAASTFWGLHPTFLEAKIFNSIWFLTPRPPSCLLGRPPSTGAVSLVRSEQSKRRRPARFSAHNTPGGAERVVNTTLCPYYIIVSPLGSLHTHKTLTGSGNIARDRTLGQIQFPQESKKIGVLQKNKGKLEHFLIFFSFFSNSCFCWDFFIHLGTRKHTGWWIWDNFSFLLFFKFRPFLTLPHYGLTDRKNTLFMPSLKVLHTAFQPQKHSTCVKSTPSWVTQYTSRWRLAFTQLAGQDINTAI